MFKNERNFEEWLDTMTDTVASWDYYTDFEKVYNNVDKIKVPLNILNSLRGSENIQEEFVQLAKNYPEVLSVLPILIAKRLKGQEMLPIRSEDGKFDFNFKNPNYSIEEYVLFMEKTGLFNLIQNKLVSNLFDYVTGVEVGLDSNGRKNRTGHAMEDLVQKYLEKYGFVMGETLFKEVYQDEVEQRFNVDLSSITNDGDTNKRFDYVAKTDSTVYLMEVNFYSSGGSKLNETARSYKMIATETEGINGVEFVWFTDGKGWRSARNNLQETFEMMQHIYNLNDLEMGVLDNLK